MKHVFSAKIWFVKTSSRIMKDKSRVVKTNPVTVYLFGRIEVMFFCATKKKEIKKD